MFQAALKTARHFTRPVIISQLLYNGKCASAIGAYVVVNKDGWFITAKHILDALDVMGESRRAIEQYESSIASITGDSSLKPNERQRKIGQLVKPKPDATRRFSPFWGPNLVVREAHTIAEVDLAVGRFVNFDASSVSVYPTFKDPSKEINPGTTLCKLGFPFHEIVPTYDEATGFRLPNGAFPIPLFPIDGMMTRTVNVLREGPPGPPRPYPLQLLETSTPGLRGQSGGPTFDVHGSIFAIQTRTQHFPLGFDTYHGEGKNRQLVPQFLNVGWGAHVTTVLGLLSELGVQFQLSTY
jgi:hypothetical protein